MAGQWSGQKELGGMGMMRLLFKVCPHHLLCLIAIPVSFFYWLASPRQRHAAKAYLAHVGRKRGSWRCFYAFSLTLIEKIEGWAGRCSYDDLVFFDDDLPDLRRRLRAGKGAMLFVSHQGNAELMRGLATEGKTGLGTRIKILSFVYFKGTSQFNEMLRRVNPESMVHLVDASNITPETIARVEETVKGGGLVVIAGDRTSMTHAERSLSIPFLGKEARFPFGAFYLAALVGVPSYSVCFERVKDLGWKHRFEMHVWANPMIDLSSRKSRMEGSRQVACHFASRLEAECRRHPYQWGNFYDFWEGGIR